MIKTTLTGATRHRIEKRWIGKPVLVLQVEEHVQGYGHDRDMDSYQVNHHRWRDACVEDITTLQARKEPQTPPTKP